MCSGPELSNSRRPRGGQHRYNERLQLVEPADPQERLGGSGPHHRDVDLAGGGAGEVGALRDVGRVADAARGRLARHMVRENGHPDAVAMVTLQWSACSYVGGLT
ncbi:MAG: hypothetical protein QOK30_2456 [Nocardioidaceae bacterium]|jgi:hypothetical protein|nr:hypothetical protein [Nocardioidaceae bacterium]